MLKKYDVPESTIAVAPRLSKIDCPSPTDILLIVICQ